MTAAHHFRASLLSAILLGSPGVGSAAAADDAPAIDTAAAAGDAAASVVVAREFMFSPTTLTVGAGSTVTWTNRDEEPHTVVSETGLFRSPALDIDQSFQFRFERPGTYRFVCSLHPQMTGTVVVR